MKHNPLRHRAVVLAGLAIGVARPASAQLLPGEGRRLGFDRITQDRIESGELTVAEIRTHGQRVFSTPFNKLDGYGDGPMDPLDPTTPGGRPTLQGNGTFLRVNGLDGQSCLECHSILSNATIPARFGIGGVGGSVTNVMAMPTEMDVDDSGGAGIATFDGRFINPPFLFGAGGVELLGKEMTADLQRLKQVAQDSPGTDVTLSTKGVQFGVIRYENGKFDTSRVEGVDSDLVVRPFGRKGEFATTRSFDVAALPFHFGMQPVESVGEGVDGDGDGVVDEVLIGEVSALAIFNTTLQVPRMDRQTPKRSAGFTQFRAIGCDACHVPTLYTDSTELTHSFPEVLTDPTANVYYTIDLTARPPGFRTNSGRGLQIPLFADLKRHDMGAELAESFGSELDAEFTTARLWGVADTAPYLHDGRALTLVDAILMHGGEAQVARDAFADLAYAEQAALIQFLQTLRTPSAIMVGAEE
jgi:hypothetical protein